MRSLIRLCAAVIAVLLAVSPGHAQQSSPVAGQVPPPKVEPLRPLTNADRGRIADDLIAKWSSVVRATPGGDVARWSEKLKSMIARADTANVLTATTATSLDSALAALDGRPTVDPVLPAKSLGNGTVGPQAIGSYDRDLTYTPLPYGRCRIADSRVISSPAPAGVARSFAIEEVASYASYGGSGSYANGTGSANCGIPANVKAYAVSVTLLSPAANGIFKVFAYSSTSQTGNSVLFNAGAYGASADLNVVSCFICAAEISIQSSASVHYIIDVVGYFAPPLATAISCADTNYQNYNMAPGASGQYSAALCPLGYTAMSVACFGSAATVTLYGQGYGACSARNTGTTAATLYVGQTCCRVPGR